MPDNLNELTTEEKINLELQNELTELHRIIKTLTAENTRLMEAIQYYFDVLEEVRGDTWKDKPDHVLKKMIDAMESPSTNRKN